MTTTTAQARKADDYAMLCEARDAESVRIAMLSQDARKAQDAARKAAQAARTAQAAQDARDARKARKAGPVVVTGYEPEWLVALERIVATAQAR